MKKIENITPARAAAMIKDGAVLVDVREAGEYAQEFIPGARHHALSRIDRDHPVQEGDKVLIFHCRSGARTNMHAKRLAAVAKGCDVYLLGGGIEAWKRAGLPVQRPEKSQAAAPGLPSRSPQIAAGLLALAGLLLGAFVAPAFYILAVGGVALLLFPQSCPLCRRS